MLHDDFMLILITIVGYRSYLIMNFNPPGELFLDLFSRNIVAILLQYITVLRCEVPALRHRDVLGHQRVGPTEATHSVKDGVCKRENELRRSGAGFEPEVVQEPF